MGRRVELPLVELAANALGPLVDEVVFVGAAVLPAWITESEVLPLRATDDTDCVIDVATKAKYDAFGRRLRSQGLREDNESAVLCRWRVPDSDLIVDVMPSEQSILGFNGKWVHLAHRDGMSAEFEIGRVGTVRIVRPELWVAMKLDAFGTRGNNDFYSSKDFDDLVSIVRGRPQLVEELRTSRQDIREFVAASILGLKRSKQFEVGVVGAIAQAGSDGIADEIVLPRFADIASLR
ncbi:MAG: hypothetical protein HYX29_03175 [Solirubrobacterales bacterium]|nr:hypothetical protein [Solirubrobacterales bacterium]